MAWMLQAVLDVTISFAHIAGINNGVADALSRAHLSERHLKCAENIVNDYALTLIDPCVHILAVLHAFVHDRRGIQLAGDSGGGQAARIEGTGDEGQSSRGRGALGGLLQEIRDRPEQDDVRGRLPMDRIPGRDGGDTGHNTKPAIARASARAARWRRAGGTTTSEGGAGGRRGYEDQRASVQPKGRDPPRDIQVNPVVSAAIGGKSCTKGGLHHHVPGRHETVGGGAAVCEEIRSDAPSRKRGHCGDGQGHNNAEVGKESAKVQPIKNHYHAPHRRAWDLPSAGGVGRVEHTSDIPTGFPISAISKDSTSGLYGLPQERVAVRGAQSRGGSKTVFPPQHTQSVCHGGLRRGMQRAGGAAPWGMVLGGSQSVHQYPDIHEGPARTGKDTPEINNNNKSIQGAHPPRTLF